MDSINHHAREFTMSIDIAAEVSFAATTDDGVYYVLLRNNDADAKNIGTVFRDDSGWKSYNQDKKFTGHGNTRYMAARGLLEDYELANGLRDSEGRRVGRDPEVLGFWCVLGFEGTRQSERWTDKSDAIVHLASLQTPAVKIEVIEPGDSVKVEATIGWATSQPKTRTVEGVAYRDDEGTLRVTEGDWEVNIERDAAGYFQKGVLLISVTKAVEPEPEPLPQVVMVWKDGDITTGLDSLRNILERPESSELDFKLYVAQDGSLVEATTRGLSASTDEDEWIHQRIALLVGETVIHTLVLRIDGRA